MYEIYLGIKRKWSISRTSREIEVPVSTVLREIKRTGATDGYNPLEINLRNVVSKNITVKNCKFANFTNNAMSVFGMAEGGVLNIENNTFDLAKTSEAVRISNKTNTKFTINVKDCSYTYPSDATGQWVGFFLFEDYTSTAAEVNTTMQFKNLTVNVDNVTFEGAKVTELNLFTGTRNQFACMCYDNLPGSSVVTDATHFPTFNFK